ncbi:DUF6259 domain-containing protein [Ruficoccus sp. ZRK36]|uniref:DUF6259 domain-containing protein n=1 Tax=Ruficoccus sp. ZRK36 TaxID=2866311 RepID=UPI001C738BAD|nr:DUF6259 domain-containing protein [Ruficoccus sp. ZRK36]QYY35227.1 hypothetical protein K0V07_13105 [Ruficoccus sp. ZRK36]
MNRLLLNQPSEHCAVSLDLSRLWTLTLVDAASPGHVLATLSSDDPRLECYDNSESASRTLTWQMSKPFDLKVQVEVQQCEDNVTELRATLVNRTVDATLKAFRWDGLRVPTESSALLIANGSGRRVTDFEQMNLPPLAYPSAQCTMPWVAMDGPSGGAYIGMHDPQDDATEFGFEWSSASQELTLSLTRYPWCPPGLRVDLPPVVVKNYTGHWSEAAFFYRRFFDQHGTVAKPPAWVETNSGWLLAIMRQQNESLNYDYTHGIDELAEIALSRGLDTLGLFGWTAGGHDHLYPDYDPDPRMGGREELKQAIKRAQARGLRVILYSNGVIMDTGTAYYRELGKHACSVDANSHVNLVQINKFNDATPVVFADACPGSPQWRRRMLALAEQALELGADGLLYDQIGVYGPHECHHPDHDHAENPMGGYTTARVRMVEQIAARMHELNPEFVLATESLIAPVAPYMHFIHGYGFGYGLTTNEQELREAFPDMIRLTFPDVIATNRIGQPLFNRHIGHYAFMHGLRQELEIRYADDVRLNRGETLDWEEAYRNPLGTPPDKATLRHSIATGEKIYMASLIGFCKRNTDILYRGRFLSDLGFALHTQELRARAFLAEDGRLGIVLWNPTDKPLTPALTVPGGTCLHADSPEGEPAEPFAEMAPESIRLVIYELDLPIPTGG